MIKALGRIIILCVSVGMIHAASVEPVDGDFCHIWYNQSAHHLLMSQPSGHDDNMRVDTIAVFDSDDDALSHIVEYERFSQYAFPDTLRSAHEWRGIVYSRGAGAVEESKYEFEAAWPDFPALGDGDSFSYFVHYNAGEQKLYRMTTTEDGEKLGEAFYLRNKSDLEDLQAAWQENHSIDITAFEWGVDSSYYVAFKPDDEA